MENNLTQAFMAARRPSGSPSYWRAAAVALPMARAALAELTETESELKAARADLGAAYASGARRYSPAMVAAMARNEKAEARHSRAFRAARNSRPVGRGGDSSSPGAPWRIGGRGATLQWVESVPFRFAGLASDLARLGHTGYYLDPDGAGELAQGVVYQTTARNGRARFIPGIADPCNGRPGHGPAMLELSGIIEAEGPDESDADSARAEAARRAGSLAESYAESERDYQEAWRAGQSARDSARECRKAGAAYISAVRALRARLKTRHGLGLFGISPDDARALARAGLAAVRAACDDYLEAREKARAELESKPYGAELAAAWAEGYAE